MAAATLPVSRSDQLELLRRRPWLWAGVALAAGALIAGITVGAVLASRDRHELGAPHDPDGQPVRGPIAQALGARP